MSEVTVIIVSYNTKSLTLECISSARESLTGTSWEIVVIDNGSSDGSSEAIRKIKDQKPKIKLIENDKNLGFAKAVNQGIKASQVGCVFLLNSDARVNKDAIKKLVSFVQETEDAGVVGARLLNPDGTLQPSCYFFPTVLRVLKRYFGGKNEVDKYSPEGSKAVSVDAVVFGAALISEKALQKVGLLNEKYFMYFEDLDYCKRVWEFGLKVYYFPSAEVVHSHGASGRIIADDANQWRRLIPSSKIYHGTIKHYLIVGIMWLGQKWERFLGKQN